MPELFQPRAISEKHIADLVRAIHQFGTVDPITVMSVSGRTILIDGHHRVEAYQRAGKTTDIPVNYFTGSVEEAVLEAGQSNSKAKLPMTGRERQDFAWRLVLLGKHSKASIVQSTGISTSQVGNMRAVRKKLGSKAFAYPSWWRARTQAQGQPQDMDEDQRELWKQELADRFADRLAKTFSTKLAERPEIAAMALATYFGRRLPDVILELRSFVSDSDDDDADF